MEARAAAQKAVLQEKRSEIAAREQSEDAELAARLVFDRLTPECMPAQHN